MPFRVGPTELLIVLAIVILLFGVGRISKIGQELGRGIREFRKGLGGDQDQDDDTPRTTKSS